MGPIRGLASNGEMGVAVNFTQPGNYVLRTKAYGDQAGPDPVKIALRLDGKDVQTFDVKAKASDPKTYEIEVKVAETGSKRFSVAFLNDFYNVKTVERKREGKPPKKEQVIEDRPHVLAGPLAKHMVNRLPRRKIRR